MREEGSLTLGHSPALLTLCICPILWAANQLFFFLFPKFKFLANGEEPQQAVVQLSPLYVSTEGSRLLLFASAHFSPVHCSTTTAWVIKFFTMRVVRCCNSCPERLWMLHPWRCSRPGWTEPWDLEVGGPACGRGLELADPWCLFQPKPFYSNSRILC